MNKTSDKGRALGRVGQKSIFVSQQKTLKEFYALSGKEILTRILEHDHPRQLIQNLPDEDFFWLVKKVGDNDCLTLLELASEEQWQYLLDLELWSKDRMHMEHAYKWLGRLQMADHERLAGWLLNEGQSLAYYLFFNSIQVEIKKEDEIYDLDSDFFTFDGLYFIRVLDKNQSGMIKNVLRTIADEDLNRYHALLLGLKALFPLKRKKTCIV